MSRWPIAGPSEYWLIASSDHTWREIPVRMNSDARMWHHVFGWVLPDVSTCYSTIIFRSQGKLSCCTTALACFDTSVTTHPKIQRHSPDDHHCDHRTGALQKLLDTEEEDPPTPGCNWPTTKATLVNNYLKCVVKFVKSVDFTDFQWLLTTTWAKSRYRIYILYTIYCILYTYFWPTLYKILIDRQRDR